MAMLSTLSLWQSDLAQDRKFGLEDGSRFATGGGDREGHGGGYKEVDREREYQRKRQREEKKEEAEKRKTDKVRCKLCKRFSCVC